MTRKIYFLLNGLWLLVIWILFKGFVFYEGYVFDYSYHNMAERLWFVSTITAPVSATGCYLILEIGGLFPGRRT